MDAVIDPVAEAVRTVRHALQRTRVPLHDEKATQAAIADALTSAGVAHEREVRLSDADIVDFMVGPVAIEVKIKGPRMDMFRQLERYAKHDQVRALVLATAKSIRLPDQINGKPAGVVSLGAAWL